MDDGMFSDLHSINITNCGFKTFNYCSLFLVTEGIFLLLKHNYHIVITICHFYVFKWSDIKIFRFVGRVL